MTALARLGSSSPNNRKGQRRVGQALVETAVGLILFVGVFVGCLLLYINTVVIGSYKMRLQIAAAEAARFVDKSEFWLGMRRPDYNSAATVAGSRKIADAVLRRFNLPPTDTFSVEQENIAIPGVSDAVTITHVKLSVNKLRTIGGLFAPFVSLDADGASAEGAIPAYGKLQMTFRDPQDGSLFKNCEVPCYWVMRGKNYAVQPNGTGNRFLVNGGFSMPTTTAFMELNVADVLGKGNITRYEQNGRQSTTSW
jgi:hypothetical protein